MGRMAEEGGKKEGVRERANAAVYWDWVEAKSGALGMSRSPIGWWKPNYLSPYLLPPWVCSSRKLKSGSWSQELNPELSMQDEDDFTAMLTSVSSTPF